MPKNWYKKRNSGVILYEILVDISIITDSNLYLTSRAIFGLNKQFYI